MKRRKKHVKQDEPHVITKAVTHVQLSVANPGKLAALDQLAGEFLVLAQRYVTLFCTDELPDGFRSACFPTALRECWQRVVMQQTAGIAKSWHINRANAYQAYLEALTAYQEQRANDMLKEGAKEPRWREWDVPTLRQLCIWFAS